MLDTLNLQSDVCQLFLNKTAAKKELTQLSWKRNFFQAVNRGGGKYIDLLWKNYSVCANHKLRAKTKLQPLNGNIIKQHPKSSVIRLEVVEGPSKFKNIKKINFKHRNSIAS